MENKPALTLEQRLAYIGDMADIETKEFTMRKAAEALENQSTASISNAEYSLSIAKRNLDISKEQFSHAVSNLKTDMDQLHRNPPAPPKMPTKPAVYDSLNKMRPKYPFDEKDYCCKNFGWAILVLLGVVFASLLFFAAISDLFFGSNWAVAIVLTLIVSVTAMIIIMKRSKEKYLRDKTEWDKYQKASALCDTYNNDLRVFQEMDKKYNSYVKSKKQYEKDANSFQQAIEWKKKALEESEIINDQIKILEKHIESIHIKKQELYSIGIIPPDYRQMDCVIMLHQIFRNGLKDNMADAILLYEERVFRQEVIRGIDKIYNMLGQLNDSMRAIESRLIEVKQELQMIGSDMSNQLAAIADNQSRILSEMEDAGEAQAAYAAAQEQWQREQLAETRASRYAAEAVQRSNEKYEWYMDQHRRGFM